MTVPNRMAAASATLGSAAMAPTRPVGTAAHHSARAGSVRGLPGPLGLARVGAGVTSSAAASRTAAAVTDGSAHRADHSVSLHREPNP